MTRNELTEKIMTTRIIEQLSWDQLAETVGKSKAWTTAALLGQMSMSKVEAETIAEMLDLDEQAVALLQTCPSKGCLDKPVPTDPLIYRFYEIIQIYGTTIKELIHEEFGDGIMSAIDFEMHIERAPDPKGDRVKLTFNGKFLPYKKW
jgi:cyanate lyase